LFTAKNAKKRKQRILATDFHRQILMLKLKKKRNRLTAHRTKGAEDKMRSKR